MRIENGKHNRVKVFFGCLLIVTGAALTTIVYYEKKVIPLKIEEIVLATQRSELFNAWIEAKFRLQHQMADEKEVNQAIENIFVLWVSGDLNLKRLINHILPKTIHRKNLDHILTKSLELDDPLGIKKYGEIHIEEDTQFISFYTFNSQGNKIRLKLIKKLKLITYNSEYRELAIKFRNDIGDSSLLR